MKYTVVWKPSAEAELASLWNAATDRAALSSAANTAERLLKYDPHSQGESRSSATRLMMIEPLAIRFSISDPDGLVEVLSVHSLRE